MIPFKEMQISNETLQTIMLKSPVELFFVFVSLSKSALPLFGLTHRIVVDDLRKMSVQSLLCVITHLVLVAFMTKCNVDVTLTSCTSMQYDYIFGFYLFYRVPR